MAQGRLEYIAYDNHEPCQVGRLGTFGGQATGITGEFLHRTVIDQGVGHPEVASMAVAFVPHLWPESFSRRR